MPITGSTGINDTGINDKGVMVKLSLRSKFELNRTPACGGENKEEIIQIGLKKAKPDGISNYECYAGVLL
jgi:hypothetical protein